jgi:putative transposase
MKGLNQAYSLYFKTEYGTSGHLWQNRFKSIIVGHDGYLLTAGIYIELNPVRAGIVSRPEEYRWSSYRYYTLGEPNHLISPAPSYVALGKSGEERKEMYRKLTAMWLQNKKGTVPKGTVPRI